MQSIPSISRALRISLFLLVAFATSLPLAASSQTVTTGRVTGRILDMESGVPLAGAQIQVGGTELGAQTDDEGRYTIAGIPAGSATLMVRRIGYEPKTVEGLKIEADKVLQQNVTLKAGTMVLSPQVVTVAEERGTVYEAMTTQRTSVGVINTVTSDQISRSPDSDAAATLSRVSGVTLGDNKVANVRGIGERNTITMLNDVRIPSPEPETKQVPLDLFPSNLLKSVTTAKTFTPDQPGDFSGGAVNIQTREFPGDRTVSYSLSFGGNTAASRQSVLASPLATSEYFGFASGSRELPSAVRAAGNFSSRNYSQAEMNSLVGSFRNVWTPVEKSGLASSSLGMTLGGNDPVLGMQLGYIASLTYSLGQEVKENEYRSRIDFNTGDSPANEFRGSTGRTSVIWGGLLNVNTFLSNKTILSLNNSYNRTADAEAHRDQGRDENLGLDNLFERSTLSYVERSVRSNQVALQHNLSERNFLDWSVTSSGVTRSEPDRADMVYVSTLNPQTGAQNPFTLFTASADGARRTFADLSENSLNLMANFRRYVGDMSTENNVKLGAQFRRTTRDAEVWQYSLATLSPLPADQGALTAEEIFDGRFTDGGQSVFTINPLSQSGSYSASDNLFAGYAMLDYGLSYTVRLVGGARLEASQVEVVSENLFGNREPVQRNFTDILPALAVNVSLTESQNLRFSATQTLARPEYRELSPILNRDVLGGQGFRGDTSLVRTLVRNVDTRWEWYPNPGEVVSVALFAKSFANPIEKVEVPTSGTSILSFINAEAAYNLGAEFELRKSLQSLGRAFEPLTASLNVTLMHSEIRLGDNATASATNPNRPMVGQAPYVVNAGLTFAPAASRLSATALFNRVGKRISAAGPTPLPDIYEMPRDMLDLALRFPVTGSIDAKFDARNVLDAPYILKQGAVTRVRYTSGSSLSLGLSWRRE